VQIRSPLGVSPGGPSEIDLGACKLLAKKKPRKTGVTPRDGTRAHRVRHEVPSVMIIGSTKFIATQTYMTLYHRKSLWFGSVRLFIHSETFVFEKKQQHPFFECVLTLVLHV
jgi:hypothetical protein